MKPFRLSRRAMLRGAGVSIGLPWLEVMAGSRAAEAAAAPPRRFLAFFTPNGSIRSNWVPTAGTSETDFTLSRILQPLQPHKGDIVVLDGVDNESAAKGIGDDHMRGMGTMLTGTELSPGDTMGGAGVSAGLAGGISVDQEMVRQLNPSTRFPSLELGVQASALGTVWGYSNYRGAKMALPPENSPLVVFNRIFANADLGGGVNATALRQRDNRKSVLDAVVRNFKSLNGKLGAADQQKLDAHLTTIEELQARISTVGAPTVVSAACKKPDVPPTFDFKANAKFPDVGKLQMDLMVMAMACDLTRVGTIQWENSVGGTVFSWLPGANITRGHHDMSHDADTGDTGAVTMEQLTLINNWFAAQMAYLIAAMKAVPEGNGTMLDNTAILWCNELSKGNVHSHPDMPFVVAGRAGGSIKTGRFLSYPKTVRAPHNNLLVSMLNAMNVDAKTFGNPAYCTGPLDRLVG